MGAHSTAAAAWLDNYVNGQITAEVVDALATAEKDHARELTALAGQHEEQVGELNRTIESQAGQILDLSERLQDCLDSQPAPDPAPGPSPRVLLGGYLGMHSENPDTRYAQHFGVTADLLSGYYQASGRPGGTINGPAEKARIDRGTIPVLTVTSVNGPYTMAQIGSGAADAWIDYWADQLAALDGEVWFTFDHEFEVKLNQGKWSPAPTIAQYVAAFNRFQRRVKARAPKVRFLYWYGYSDQAKIAQVGAGIDRPDIIALDPYVFAHHASSTTFEQMAQPKLDWLRGRSWYDGQPVVFAEFAKDLLAHGDAEAAAFLTDLRPRAAKLGVSGLVYFCRDKTGDIQANLTVGNWPLAKAAFAASTQR